MNSTHTSIRILGLTLFLGLNNPTFAGNSGIPNPTYKSIEDEILKLAEEYPDWVEHIQYGKTVEGRDMHMLRLAKKTVDREAAVRQAVYIDGTIHGNEYLHIEDRLARHFIENRDQLPQLKTYFDNGGVIYVVPIFNPDGFVDHQRGNARGKDLNRDFPLRIANHRGLKQVETQQFTDYFENSLRGENRKLEVSMNYHCCDGSLITPWSVDGPDLSSEDLAAHEEIGQIVKEEIGNDYEVGSTGAVLGQSHAGTAKDYFYETHHARAFTFEGKFRIEDKNFPKHVKMWERIFGVLNR